MDELVHHCLRELAFDGDLGCNVSRLRDFVVGFYASQDDHKQLVDDAFCAFVWSVVVQQPSVRVGTLPPGLASEVYIAPQMSAKRKAAAKGEELAGVVSPSLRPVEDARHRSLEDLKREYGDNLRIAVDPETSFAAITGSHIRPSKLSPMVYSALQLITRGREGGITTVELGRKTNYDQKTCFYLIKQLVELDLVIKARRGGVGNHACIHKYFVERSPLWQQIQEEARYDESLAVSEPVRPRDAADEVTDEIAFDPIDSRHLSSLPLVKNRIVKLLKATRDHIYQSNNLLMTIGFVKPTRTDRRFFQTRLRELVQQGIIERVLVPSSKIRDRTVKCIRLVASDNQLPEGSVVMEQDVDEDEKDPSLAEDGPVDHNEVKANTTIHKQVSNMLEEAGLSGLTLNEICVSLGNFDKRTIELLLTRASNSRPPAHLGDLGTIDLMETYGRERRHRYFTLAAYKCVVESERLQDTTMSVIDIDQSRVGDFAALDLGHFYTSTEKLHSLQDSLKDLTAAKGKKRKRDEEGSNEEGTEQLPKPKRGRPRNAPALKDASTSPQKKRGRPRKNPLVKHGETQRDALIDSPSKRVVDIRVGTADVSSAAGQPEQNILPAFAEAPVVADNNQLSVTPDSRVICPVQRSACFPLTTQRPDSCSVKTGTSHAGFEEQVDDVHPCHSVEPIPNHSSNISRIITLDLYGCSTSRPQAYDVMVSEDSQSLEGDEPKRKSHSAPVTREENSIDIPPSARQESSPAPSREVDVGEKHSDVASLQSSRPLKRSRTNEGGRSRSNINISSLRRENELLRVIEDMGGIANVHSKDIFEAHAALLDTLSQAKESTSAPAGTRLDKRTAESTLKNLESRGRIRMLKTSLVSPSGVTRPACLVYLLDTPQEEVNTFLRQLNQSMSSSTKGSHLIQNGDVTSITRQDSSDRFTDRGRKIVPDIEKESRIAERKRKEEAQRIEAKATLRKKAEKARAKREQGWDDLLRKFHPGPLTGTLAVRIRALRGRFIESTIVKDQSHWENEVQEAIKEARLTPKNIVSQLGERLSISTGPPPIVPNPPEKSIEFLITQQGPPITQSAKRKGKAKEEGEASRRPRFHWTREFDELARDASAIIRARCRTSRLDLSAFDQVFPAVPRNSVRQRITHLRDNAAEDLYMKRLEDQWHAVWLQQRGTPHLPDEDPSSPSNFSLINHIEFLRKHVDKNALRVGFVERETPSKLAVSVEELHRFYNVKEDVVSAPAWDFMWGTTVEEGREKQFRNQAFSKEPDNLHEGAKNEKVQLAEASLKMVFGTPGELYNFGDATRLLHSAGDQYISTARSNLLYQGVLSKLVRDPKKPKPGRTLKISDINLNGLGGPFPRDLFQDAISLEEIAVEKVVDEMEWPLISSEGDIATLLQLVSEDQIEFTVDLSQSRAARQKIDWNSKRADDEDIETGIRLRFSRTSVVGPGGNQDQSESPIDEPDSNTSDQEIHGRTLEGSAAACALKTDAGLINCSACINSTFSLFTSCLSQPDRDLAGRILDHARSSRESGIDKAACLTLEAASDQHILWLVHKMTLTSPPMLLWIYFNVPTIVAGDYCGAWGVEVSDAPLTLISPRRWLDLRGYRLESAWKAAQQAVAGVVFLHPGISQTELRWRLRTVYDKQEIIDLLSALQEDDVLECRTDAGVEAMQSWPGWLKGLDDEQKVFWFIAKNHHWYQF